MVFSNITSKVADLAGKAKLMLKIKSPEILLGTGIALVVGGTVVACMATNKAKDIIEAKNNEIAEIKDRELKQIDEMKEHAEALGLTVLPEDNVKEITKETRSDIFVANVRCWWGLAKLFGPAIIIEGTGLFCICKSHSIIQNRYTGAVAAYEATNAAYRKLKDKYEKDIENVKNRSEGILEPEKGIVEANKEDLKPPFDPDVYDFCFDESCDAWKPNPCWNWDLAKSFERALNTYFQTFGYAFLNDCRTSFGKDNPGSNSSGQVIGWSKSMGDTYVDFGLGKGPTGDCNIWIRPNCHHMILGCSELNKR